MSQATDALLNYVREAKKLAAVRGHQGFREDDFQMGKAAAYQDIEDILTIKERSEP